MVPLLLVQIVPMDTQELTVINVLMVIIKVVPIQSLVQNAIKNV